MNWTEGGLARHSRRKGWNESASKQKEYFAKARSRLQHDSQTIEPAQFVPSYMVDSSQERHLPTTSTSRTRSRRGQLLSLAEASPSSEYRHEDVLEENIHGKRQFEALSDAPAGDQAEEDINTKRLRLLKTADWSGVAIQKPLIVRYPSNAQSSELSKYCSRTQAPRQTHHLRKATRAVSPGGKAGRNDRENNIAIQIGSDNYRWSPENNTIRALSRQDWRKEQRSGPSSSSYQEALFSQSSTSHDGSSSLTESPCVRQSLLLSKRPLNQWVTAKTAPSSTPSTTDGAQYVVLSSPQALHHPQPSNPRSHVSLIAQSPISLLENRPSSLILQNSSLARELPALEEFDRRITETSQGPGRATPIGSSLQTSQLAPYEIFASESCRMGKPQSDAPLLPYSQAMKDLSVCGNIGSPLAYEDVSSPGLGEESFLDLLDQFSEHDELPCDAIEDVHEQSFLPFVHENEVNTVAPAGGVEPAPSQLAHGGPDNALNENAIWQQFVFGSLNVTNHNDATEQDSVRSEVGRDTSEFEAPTGLARHDPEPPQEIQRAAPGGSTTAPPSATPPRRISTEAAAAPGGEELESRARDRDTPPVAEPRDMARIPRHNKGEASPPGFPTLASKKQASEFRFHLPHAFVGRLATGHETGARASVCEVQQPPRKSRKKRESGRPDIRAMPNIKDDPIECTP